MSRPLATVLPCSGLRGLPRPSLPGASGRRPGSGSVSSLPCVSEEGGRDGGCAGAAGRAQVTGQLGEVAMKDGWGQLTGASCVSKFSPHFPLDGASFSSVCMNGRSGDGGWVHQGTRRVGGGMAASWGCCPFGRRVLMPLQPTHCPVTQPAWPEDLSQLSPGWHLLTPTPPGTAPISPHPPAPPCCEQQVGVFVQLLFWSLLWEREAGRVGGPLVPGWVHTAPLPGEASILWDTAQ